MTPSGFSKWVDFLTPPTVGRTHTAVRGCDSVCVSGATAALLPGLRPGKRDEIRDGENEHRQGEAVRREPDWTLPEPLSCGD